MRACFRSVAGLAAVALLLLAVGLPPAARADGDPGLACPAEVGLPPLALPVTERTLSEGRPVTVLAFGSSSTEGAGASASDRTYPARLEARLRHALPGVRVSVLNRGRGGEEVTEMLARLDREVLAAGPTLVVWQAGANAVLRGMPPEAFRAAMAEGVERIRAAGADVVLMDSQRAPRILGSANHRTFDVLMVTLAQELRVPLFSRAELMRRWEARGAPNAEFLTEDGLHHNDRGYECLAAALARGVVAALRRPAMVAGR